MCNYAPAKDRGREIAFVAKAVSISLSVKDAFCDRDHFARNYARLRSVPSVVFKHMATDRVSRSILAIQPGFVASEGIMKKILIGIVALIVVVVTAIAAGVVLFLDSGIKRGVETLGPQLTKVDVKLDGVSVSLLSGSGKIKGLVVGNPAGYQTPHAIRVDAASLALMPGSIFSDKVIIKSIRVESPNIYYEGGLDGDNLRTILNNVSASKKLQVDDLVITGAKVNVSVKGTGGLAAPITLPDIHLTNLGQGPEGITAAELTKKVLSEITSAVAQHASNVITEGAVDSATKVATKAAIDIVEKAITKGVAHLFKKTKE
jgi:uncharacterized protein involved in outer membrane biogenesis